MPKCSSAWVSECPSVQVPKCLSSQVPKCLECLNAQVSFKCPSAWVHFEWPSASSAQVSKCLECPISQVPFECPSALSARVPECSSIALSVLSAWVPFKCPSAQVSKCLSALSARVPKCPLSARVSWVHWVLQVFEFPSAFCAFRVEVSQYNS